MLPSKRPDTKMALFLTIIIIVIFTITNTQQDKDNKNNKQYGVIERKSQIEEALDKVLTYILEHNHLINIDGLFGVMFAQVHLMAIIKTSEVVNQNEFVHKLKAKSDLIYDLIKDRIYNGDNRDAKQIIFIEKIINQKLWHRDIKFRYGLNPKPPKYQKQQNKQKQIQIHDQTKIINNQDINDDMTYDEYMTYLSSSNMSETQSDECLLQLIQNQNEAHHECQISAICRLRMIDDTHYDPTYGITHRLLYLQIAHNRQCAMNPNWYTAQTQLYCSYILWEVTKNANFGFIDELDDLLLEQMTLCGYEGFSEFLTTEICEHVLDAQTPHGCFGIPQLDGATSQNNKNKRNKRSANVMTFGCNDHTTGLAASTLALILRMIYQSLE